MSALKTALKDRARRAYVSVLRGLRRNERSEQYWNRHHVDAPDDGFADAPASLDHLAWRNAMYPGQGELVRYDKARGLAALDYGCGPGNDVVGLGLEGGPASLFAMDVSAPALALAERRAALHEIACTFHRIAESDPRLPLADASIDYIQCFGVLHHTPDPVAILREFRRLLRPGGATRVMVYNRHSIWMHLHVAWDFQINKGLFADLAPEQAFSRSTDGYNCPIANGYAPAEWIELCAEAGFRARFDDAAISLLELRLLPRLWDALADKRLPAASRRFLAGLRYNDRGFPLHDGKVAGLNAFYDLEPTE